MKHSAKNVYLTGVRSATRRRGARFSFASLIIGVFFVLATLATSVAHAQAYSCIAGNNVDIAPVTTGGQFCSPTVPLVDGSSIVYASNSFTACFNGSNASQGGPFNYLVVGSTPSPNVSGTGVSTATFSDSSHYFTAIHMDADTTDCDSDWPGASSDQCEIVRIARSYTTAPGTYIDGISASEYTNVNQTVLCTGAGVPEGSCGQAGDIASLVGTSFDSDSGAFDIDLVSGGGFDIASFRITDLLLDTDGSGPIGTDFAITASWSCRPGIEKSFAASPLEPGDTTTLTITLYNGEPTAATSASFTDTLPAELLVNGTPTNNCGGSVVVSGQDVTLTGGSIPAASGSTPGSCTIIVPIIVDAAASAGSAVNTIPSGALTSIHGVNVPPATDTVVIVLPQGDYGDAPTTYDGSNPTTAARHITPSASLYLGNVFGDIEGPPPPWALALGLPNGDDNDAEGDDEDGVDINSLVTYSTSGTFAATLDVTGVTNDLGSDAQLVCWIDFGQDGTFSDTSGNNGAGSPNERSHPELVAHTLTGSGGPATDHYALAQTNAGVNNPGNALGAPDGSLAGIGAGDVLILDMGASVTIPNGSTFTLWARGGFSGDGNANIETSPDNATWTSASPASLSMTGVTTVTAFPFTAQADARYVRITRQSGAVRFDALHYQEPASGGACSQTGITDSTYTTGNVPAGCQGTAQMFWTNIPSVPISGNVYSRCRVTTDTSFFSDASPSAIGAVTDGEVEDDGLPMPPTAVTIGDVTLESISVAVYLSEADLNQLQVLPASFGVNTDGMDREALVAALTELLDPDGDGQVALFRWDTLEERGTIGFYAERHDGEDDWIRINNDLLPGMITAPMGAEYLLTDPAAQSGTTYQYRLIELEADGHTRTYGPFTLQMR